MEADLTCVPGLMSAFPDRRTWRSLGTADAFYSLPRRGEDREDDRSKRVPNHSHDGLIIPRVIKRSDVNGAHRFQKLGRPPLSPFGLVASKLASFPKVPAKSFGSNERERVLASNIRGRALPLCGDKLLWSDVTLDIHQAHPPASEVWYSSSFLTSTQRHHVSVARKKGDADMAADRGSQGRVEP